MENLVSYILILCFCAGVISCTARQIYKEWNPKVTQVYQSSKSE